MRPATLAVTTLLAIVSTAYSQAAKPAQTVALSCPIRTTSPSAADLALDHDKYDDAIDLYRKDSKTADLEGDRAHNGLIRALLAAGKTSEADTDAHEWATRSPTNSWAMASLDEVQLHHGSVDQAIASIQAAGRLDHCNMQVHIDFAKFSRLTGMNLTAKRHLDVAHTYDPLNPEIVDAWSALQPRSVKLEHVTHTLETDKSLSGDERKSLEKWRESLTHPAEPCRLVSKVTSAIIPFQGIKNGPTGAVHWGLIVAVNGTERRMEIDTGASGLTLSHSAAAALQLKPDAEGAIGGVGNDHATRAFRAHVKSIKIGNLEFENCDVDVLESDVAVLTSQDGLIGGDVFGDFLLTLDFPAHQLRLDPLPPIPGTENPNGPSLTTEGDADTPVRDAYTAPGMQNWSAVLRLGHELLLPVRLNGKTPHLFMLDTGADVTMISAEAAREATKVSAGPDMGIHGLSGEIHKTYLTDKVEFDFAGLRYPAYNVIAVDQDAMWSQRSLEVSGFLGAGILRMTTMQIDYRDDLVHFTYDPKRLTPCMPGVYREDCYK